MTLGTNRIRLVYLGDANRNSSVASNTGTVLTRADANYFLPKDDWADVFSVVEAKSDDAFQSSVTIFPVGLDLVKKFRSQLPELLDPVNTSPEERSSILIKMASDVSTRIGQLGIEVVELRVSNVAVNKPGTKSTGKDFQTNERVGLHIDNHDRLPLLRRFDAVRLLAINCGSADRFLMYVDLPVRELANKLAMQIDDPTEDPKRASDDLKTAFLARFPDYPVNRVRIPPGYAYIATPQDFIHDGAGSNDSAPDIAFLMLGRYRMNGGKT